MRRSLKAAALVAFLVAATADRRARASAFDVFGLGSEASGVAGAAAARSTGYAAGFYNPASLAALTHAEAGAGLLGFGSQLRTSASSGPQSIADPVGLVVGAAAPVPFGSFLKDRLYAGIALYIVPGGVVRVIAHSPEQPFFPYYDNRTQRLVVLPSLALRIGGGLSAGVAVNYLAGLRGQVDAAEGVTRAIEPRTDEQIFAHARVHVGLRWQSPRDRVAAALVYRQGFSVPFSTASNSIVAGQALDLAITAEGLYTPDQLVVGGAFRPLPWMLLSADVGLALWSAWKGPYVTVVSNLPIVGVLSAPPPVLRYENVYSVRAGFEARRALASGPRGDVDGKLRAGYAFETSPIPTGPDAQSGVTNLLDGPKHTLAAGAGLRIPLGSTALRIDAHAQIQIVQSITLVKVVAPAGTSPDPAKALRDEKPDDPNHPETLGLQISNPGYPTISGGGFVWSAGLMLTVER